MSAVKMASLLADQTKRWVICTNDFPYVVLPEGTTQHEVDETIRRLRDSDEARRAKFNRGKLSALSVRPVYYHAHEMPVVDPEEVTPWRNEE